jgi:hypothetical protein
MRVRRLIELIATVLVALAAHAESSAAQLPRTPRRLVFRVIHTYSELAATNWIITVSARTNGVVELALESKLGSGSRIPWIITDSAAIHAEPIISRGAFAPAEIKRVVQYAESLLANPPLSDQSHRDATKRPRIELTTKRRAHRLYPFTTVQDLRFSVTPSVYPVPAPWFDISGSTCLSLQSAPVWLLGFGGETWEEHEYRLFIAALDNAATWADMWSQLRREWSRPDLIRADDAACPAQPIHRNPIPRFPARVRDDVVEMDVHFDAVVDTAGRIEPASLRSMSGASSAFVKEARSKLIDWKFLPAMLTDGLPVRQRVHFHVHFAREAGRDVDELARDATEHGAEILVLARPARSGAGEKASRR